MYEQEHSADPEETKSNPSLGWLNTHFYRAGFGVRSEARPESPVKSLLSSRREPVMNLYINSEESQRLRSHFEAADKLLAWALPAGVSGFLSYGHSLTLDI